MMRTAHQPVYDVEFVSYLDTPGSLYLCIDKGHIL